MLEMEKQLESRHVERNSVECLDFGLILDCIYVVTSFESWSSVNHFHDIKLAFRT